jgi:RNA polymerase sigma factor (sigma-70 family)
VTTQVLISIRQGTQPIAADAPHGCPVGALLQASTREGVAVRSGVDAYVAPQKSQLCGGRRERALSVLAVAEPEFRRTARRVSLCADDAEDAFQRAVEILLTKAPERPPNALIAWMQVVTRREALAVRRARERVLATWGDDGNDLFDALLCERPGPMERAEHRDRVAAAAEALAELKPDERLAIVLQAHGYSYAEIGELCGWTYTKVNRCLAEGRARLRKLEAR